jgi:hypothetical protein
MIICLPVWVAASHRRSDAAGATIGHAQIKNKRFQQS